MLILSVWNTRHSEFIAKRRLSITNLSSENNLPMFQLNAPVFLFINPFTLMIFSRNIGKLFSELKLVTDNLLFIYAAANWEATERWSTYLVDLDCSFDWGVDAWYLQTPDSNAESLCPPMHAYAVAHTCISSSASPHLVPLIQPVAEGIKLCAMKYLGPLE